MLYAPRWQTRLDYGQSLRSLSGEPRSSLVRGAFSVGSQGRSTPAAAAKANGKISSMDVVPVQC